MFIFSPCHFPYGHMNVLFLGDDYILRNEILFYLSIESVMYLIYLFIYCSSHFKEEFKQLTRRYKQNEEIY